MTDTSASLAAPARQTAVIVGAGPSGLLAAHALAHAGATVELVAPAHKPAPGRTVALFAGSIELLRNLAVFEHVSAHAARIVGIRLIDDTGGVLRAPEALFRASDLGLDAFGYNIPNDTLVSILASRAEQEPRIRQWSSPVTSVSEQAGRIDVLGGGSPIAGRLLVAADGRNSICRQAAGITAHSWSYPQSAIVTTLQHSREHHGISSELHRRAGPLTVVPLRGRRSSLVWVERREAAERLGQLSDEAFTAELELHLQGLLGMVGDIAPRAVVPLSGLTADRFAARRTVLIGETAHVFPPIGAQGLNLGIRDVAVLADLVADAIPDGTDIGGADLLADYDRARRVDIATRTTAVDLLNRSLLAGLLPVDLLRGAALHAITALAPLRDLIVRQGLGPPGRPPRLMRPSGA